MDAGDREARLEQGFRSRPGLLALGVGLPVGEYLPLQAFGLTDALPLAPQLPVWRELPAG